ncbi:MAG: acyl-CoA dehydrogenase family protein [Candidatus Limnocylindrales bacterium]
MTEVQDGATAAAARAGGSGTTGTPAAASRPATPGGAFVVRAAGPEDVFTPERLDETQRAIRDAVLEFVARSVEPRREAVEARDYATHRALMAELGEQGYLGIDVPEAYGGAGLDKVTSLLVSEALADAGGLAVTYGAHVGIGTLPLVFFGTDEQRRRWLPQLASGSLIAAYALTEPGAGSDVQGIRARADLAPDGSCYLLNGTKQFITNAGFADLFTVYARIDGERMTAFLVPRDTPGLSVGAEEHKLGVRGSSTCALTFTDARVPVENVLGEIGRGHIVAYNVLNVGRFKLAAGCLGGMRPTIDRAIAYATDRRLFGQRLLDLPLTRERIATMAERTYAVESATYRNAGLIDTLLAGAHGDPERARGALEEYAIECSIVKVVASDGLNRVVDDLLQLMGGYGYIEDGGVAAMYRDARIHQIWEGTNEVNRLLVPGMLLRRAMRGRLDLLGPARRAAEALLSPEPPVEGGAPLDEELRQVRAMRTALLVAAGAAVQRYGEHLEEEQEVLYRLADLAIALFAAESSALRARASGAELQADLARLVVARSMAAVETGAAEVATRVQEGDDRRLALAGLRRVLRREPVDLVALRRSVAEALVARGGYRV